MPLYECILQMPGFMDPKGAAVILRRICAPIVQDTGVIRTIDNLGRRPMFHSHQLWNTFHRVGTFIRIRFDCTPMRMKAFDEYCKNENFVFQ
jgi:hypothetical protein